MQVWMTLAVLLPIGIAAATLSIAKKQYDQTLQPAPIKALPVILKSSNDDNYAVSVRSDASHTSKQLEWTNKAVLTAPAALIYALNEANASIDNAALIGRIEGKGTYYFALPNDTTSVFHFALYDIIHHQIIYTIHL